MKLRLPHKFQTALMAALASVSFTTLSTGSAAYAADVQLADMTQWEGYDEDSGAAFVGSMGATNNAGTVYTGTTNYNIEPQWNSTWSFVVTVDAASLVSSANQTLLATIMSNKDDTGYSEGVKATTSGSTATVILTSWSNAGQSTTVNVADYNDLTFVLSRDTDKNLKFAVYGDGNFTKALYTAQVNGQTFGSTSMAAVTTGGLDSQYHKHKNSNNGASLPADSTVGSFVVTGAAYTWGSKITEEQLGTYYTGISHTALTWNGTGSATTWNKSAENWLNGDAPATYDESAIAVFAAGEAGKTVTLGESLSAYELKFQESYTLNLGSSNLTTTAGWDITSGKTLTLNGTGTASAWTITGGGALANNARLQLGGLGNSTIGSVISGSGSVEKVGAGTLTLTAANTFTGSLTISEGTVKVNNDTALGQINASRLIKVAAGATLDVNGNEGTGNGYTVTLSGGTLTNTGAGKDHTKRQYVTHLNLTADSKVVAASNFGLIGSNYAATSIDLGGHTLTIEGPSTYFVNNATITGGGQLKVASGTLNFNTKTNDNQVGSFASNFELAGGTLAGRTLTLARDIYINTTATASSTMSLPVKRAGHGITFKGDGALTVSGNLTGLGSLAKEGAGALTITGSLDVNSTIRLDGGSLALGGTVTLDLANFNAFEVADATGQQYSYNNVSGFLTASGKYYLVHATGEPTSTAAWTGSFADGSATYDEASSVNGNIVFSLNTLPPSTSYYVNADMDTRSDVTGGTNNLLTKATDVCIKKGVTLTAFSYSDSFTNAAKLHGEGTYALANNRNALNSKLGLGTDWTGVVRISGYSFANDMTALNSLGNSNSWVELVGVHGWSNSNTINANLILGANSDGWSYYQDNGNTGQTLTFAGMIKGDGKMGRYNDKGTVFTYEFTNDISGWTGTFESRSQSGGSTTFRVKDNATVVNAILDNKSNNLYVDVQNNATFNAEIKNATKLTIASGKTATLAASATLGSLAGAGALVVDSGSNAVTVNGSNNYTGSITVDGGTLALGNHQFTGVPSLTINDGGTVTTNNDNGNGMVRGTITINAGGTLKATGGKDIFGYEGGATNKVVMQGSADKQAKIDLSGLASGNSVTMTTDLEMKGYSTISGGAINSWDGAITVSGTNNTISDFALRKAVTIDVAAGGALEIGNLGRFAAFDGGLTKTGAGTLTLKGGVIDTAITMSGGTLALDGTFTVDDLDMVGEPTVYYVGAEVFSHNTNGVRGGQLDLQLLTAGSTGTLSIAAAARFSYDGQTMTGSVGEAGAIHLVSEGFSSTFYINEASERTAWIFRADTDYPATDISIARGTTLVVDDNAEEGFSASKIHVQDGSGYANLQIQTGNKVNADGTDRALQLSGAGEYKLNSGVGLGSISTAETTAATPWTGTIDATEVNNVDKLFNLYTASAVHGGTVQLKTVTGDSTADHNALELQLGGGSKTASTYTFAQTTFKTEAGGNLRFSDYDHEHSWIVGNGTTFDIGGDIRMDHRQTLSIQGGAVTTGGKVVLGHSGSGNAAGLNMTAGSLKTSGIQVIIGGTGNAAPISITGGTLEFTSANPLLLSNNSAATVTLGGSNETFVTLKADTVSWTLAHDGMTIGNIKAETANGGAITLGTAGKAASYTGKVEVAENSSLTLDGILTLGANGIVTSGVLGVSNTTVFNLEHMEARQVGDKFVYSVFTGAGANLSTQGFTAAGNIIGISTAGKEWTFGNDGTISYVMLSSELVWKGENGIGVWNTASDNQPWLNGETPSAFRNDDEVTFDSTYSTAATATLGGNVEAASITVAAGANVHVAQDAQEAYTLASSSLVVNGTLTSDMSIDGLEFITVGNGATWNTVNALDITDNGGLQSFSNAGTIKLLSGARMDVDMTAGKTQPGVVTAAEGGTLHLHNAPGGAATFNGHNDFLGTLVYDVVSTNGHDASVTLENFNGTLELRGRLAASASNFGGMTKLVLFGDRDNHPSNIDNLNTTGLWNKNALTLSVPVEVKGDETVDLYTSNALTLTGDINSAGAKQGHLSKRNTGALNLQGGVYLLSYDNNAGTVNMSGGADIATLNAVSGTVALGGQDKTYTLGAVVLGISTGGQNPTLSIGAGANATAATVKVEDGCGATIALAADFSITDSLSTMGAGKTLTIKTADGTEGAKTLTAGKLDLANVNTGIALQNAILTVTGKASVAEIITSRTNNNGLMTVDSGATLNLNGGVNWSRDGKFVNLAIADGGDVNISTVAGNVLNDLTIERGGDLTIGAGATTSVEGTATISDVITANANIAFNGAVDINGMSDAELTSFTKGQDGRNGFKQFSGALTVVDISGGGSVSVKEGTVISYNGKAGELGADGKFHLEETTVEYDAFFVNTNDTGESLDRALAAAEAASGTMTTVQLTDNTTLTMDRADAALPHLVLKEGASSATLNVTQSSSIASVEGIGAGQTLNITGTTGKVLTLTANNTMTGTVDVQSGTLKTTTETTLGNAHVDVAADGTLELDANLTLANGLDNAGTISMAGKTLTLNGTTAYNLGNVTGNDQSYITVGNNATAVVDGNVTVRRVYGNAGSNIKVEEGATLNLLTTERSNYSEIHGDLDIKGMVSFKSDGGDMRFWGTSDNQVFNLGHLVVDGDTGQVDLLTAGGGNYTSTIAAKSLSGGSLSHILEVTTCYTGGTAGTGKVVKFVIGDENSTATAASYTGTIKYGVGSGSVQAGGGMNLVIKDEYVAANAVLETIMGGGTYGTVTVDTERAKVKGLKDAASGKTVNVSGTAADKNRVLEIVGNDNYTYNGKLGANLDVVHSGSGTQSFGGVDGFNGSIDVEGGTLNIMNIAEATNLNVKDVTIAANATMGVYTGNTADEANVGKLTIAEGSTLKAAGENATLNADVDMVSGSTLEVSLAQASHGITMGCSVSLNTGDLLGADDLGFVQKLNFGEYYYLFNDVESLSVNGTQYESLNFKDYRNFDMDASVVYNTQLDEKRYALVYRWDGSNVGTIAITLIPEPTTGTLSLLALCALAARRRRK